VIRVGREGSAYNMQPYKRSNSGVVDGSIAAKLRYSVSDGPRGHCARLSLPRVGHISRQGLSSFVAELCLSRLAFSQRFRLISYADYSVTVGGRIVRTTF